MKTINKRDINATAELLSRCFYLDPLFQYFFPDDNTRQGRSYYTFRFILSHALKKGFAFATSPALEGAAIWLPSASIHRSLIDQIRFGALAMYIKQPSDSINRQISASEHMKSLHSATLSVPHLYLSTIGMDEPYRGKGFASGLILPVLQKADKDRLPCYLDTHNENNVALYQRFGFRVAHETTIPDSNVHHWAMIRDSK